MRKILTLILIVLVSVSFVFAAGKTEKPATTITFAAQSTPTMDYLVSIIPEFEAKTGIKVIADMMPYDALVQKVTIDTTTNTKQYAAF